MAERALTDIEVERMERWFQSKLGCLSVAIGDHDRRLESNEVYAEDFSNGGWIMVGIKLSAEQIREIIETEGKWE